MDLSSWRHTNTMVDSRIIASATVVFKSSCSLFPGFRALSILDPWNPGETRKRPRHVLLTQAHVFSCAFRLRWEPNYRPAFFRRASAWSVISQWNPWFSRPK